VSQALASDPFGALESAGAGVPTARQTGWVPIVPVPPDAHPVGFRHPEHGQPSATWAYKDEAGRVLGYVARFDGPMGKEILPRTWCLGEDGFCSWRWKSFVRPRPLYGLDRLAARPEAPVLVVEGEKSADAAQALFPDLVAVTWPGGSNAVRHADWSPLTGREIVLWPDADAPGRKAMGEIAAMLLRSGAAVRIVPLPDDLPEGWDLADDIPEGLDMKGLLDSADRPSPATELPPGYVMSSRGLIWRDPFDEDKPEVLVASAFEVLAETRDSDGGSWGVLLSWDDHDGRAHRLALPRATLAGDGAEARRLLLDGGMYVGPNRAARERLNAFFLQVRSTGRVTATSRIGWHDGAFVLPEDCIGATPGEELLLQGSGAVEHAFRQRGSLENWQHEIARLAVGNSRLALVLSMSFAAVLVGPCGAESGGIHLRGPSSIGKSTLLTVAGSVWGGGEPGGYVRSWRATANGLEGVALGHCDALLCLDELAQLSAREAGEVAYMLANGSGKSRSSRDGSARRASRWRLLLLSSGEIGLADKVAEDGRARRSTAGQEVRIVDLPADAEAGMGLFEELHGFPSAEALARHLRTAANRSYGTPARAFLKEISRDLDSVRQAVTNLTREFLAAHVPPGADGQVLRVAQRFALVAAGGELAVAAGVLPWPPGEATNAAARCFRDWILARGGVEPAEVRTGLAQVRSFLLAHGMSRFVPAWEEEPKIPPRDVTGYRRKAEEGWDYFVTPSAWAEEVCRGLNPQAVAAAMIERGLLQPQDERHRAKSVTVPGIGKVRVYHIPAGFLGGADD